MTAATAPGVLSEGAVPTNQPPPPMRSPSSRFWFRLVADQPVYVHVPGLADAVAADLRLRVHRRVPVGVVEHHRIAARQVDAHAAPERDDRTKQKMRLSALDRSIGA